jgi:hypothetical protein
VPALLWFRRELAGYVSDPIVDHKAERTEARRRYGKIT